MGYCCYCTWVERSKGREGEEGRRERESENCKNEEPTNKYVIGYEKRDHFAQKLDFAFAAPH